METIKPFKLSTGVWISLLSIIILATGLRFFQLDKLPLWNDESIQLNGLSMPYEKLVSQHLKGIDHMPPLSYSIQRMFWLRNQTIHAAKLPGALLGVLMVPLAFWTFRRMKNPLLALLAAFFSASLFYLVYYSQELRCYIFFGFGLWLFLGAFLKVLMTPIDEKVSWYLWVLTSVGAILAGSFHYAAQLVLPPAGGCAFLIVVMQYLGEQKQTRSVKPYIFRMIWIGSLLILALLVCYIEMKYFMGGKLQGMLAEVKNSALPHPSLMYDVFIRYAWGGGWRMLCFVVVIGLGAYFSSRRERLIMLFAASLAVSTFLLCFYVYPRLGQRPASMASIRYMFWTAWCVMVLLSCSFYALWNRYAHSKVGYGMGALLGLICFSCMGPAYSHYYRMDAKRMNLDAAKKAVENIDGHRLLLLGNTYDMHHLRAAWPTNCTYAALPAYGKNEYYERQGLSQLMMSCVKAYPNIVVKKSSYSHEAALSSFDEASAILHNKLFVDNDLHALCLYEMGLNPMIGKPLEYAYSKTDDLVASVMKTGGILMLYPCEMPLIPTRERGGEWTPWRLLQQPLQFQMVNGGEPRRVRVSLPFALIGRGALRVEAGGYSKLVEVKPALHQLLEPSQNQWVQSKLTLQQVASLGSRLQMQLATSKIVFDLSLEPGINAFKLIPIQQAVLLGPPPEETSMLEVHH